VKSITPHTVKKVFEQSDKAFGLFALTLLFFSSFLILNQNAEAQLICPPGSIEQITDDPVEDSRSTSINTDGTRIAFRSTADITGGNPEGNSEIYLSTCLDLTTTGGGSCALASPGATNFSTPIYLLIPALILIIRLWRRRTN